MDEIERKIYQINNSIIKNTIDFILSLIFLILLSPLFLVIAILIKLDSKGGVFVRLKRVSEGKIFKVYKFRTMIKGAHKLRNKLLHLNERKDGPFFKIRNDPRITRFGKILRKFRIDEMPQLINVLKGEMSLIGPRAHELREIKKYPQEYKIIAKTKAGITGLSQVSGASSLPFLKELELDKFYIENWSLWLDFKIFLKTIWIFFSDPTGV